MDIVDNIFKILLAVEIMVFIQALYIGAKFIYQHHQAEKKFAQKYRERRSK